jgi:hypothetical protein
VYVLRDEDDDDGRPGFSVVTLTVTGGVYGRSVVELRVMLVKVYVGWDVVGLPGMVPPDIVVTLIVTGGVYGRPDDVEECGSVVMMVTTGGVFVDDEGLGNVVQLVWTGGVYGRSGVVDECGSVVIIVTTGGVRVEDGGLGNVVQLVWTGGVYGRSGVVVGGRGRVVTLVTITGLEELDGGRGRLVQLVTIIGRVVDGWGSCVGATQVDGQWQYAQEVSVVW